MKNKLPKPLFTKKIVYGKRLYKAENRSAELWCKFVDPRRTTLSHTHMRLLKTLGVAFELTKEIKEIV